MSFLYHLDPSSISSHLIPPLQHWWQAVNIIMSVITVSPELSTTWNHHSLAPSFHPNGTSSGSVLPHRTIHSHTSTGMKWGEMALFHPAHVFSENLKKQVVSHSISVTFSSSPKSSSTSWQIYSHLPLWSCPVTSFSNLSAILPPTANLFHSISITWLSNQHKSFNLLKWSLTPFHCSSLFSPIHH